MKKFNWKQWGIVSVIMFVVFFGSTIFAFANNGIQAGSVANVEWFFRVGEMPCERGGASCNPQEWSREIADYQFMARDNGDNSVVITVSNSLSAAQRRGTVYVGFFTAAQLDNYTDGGPRPVPSRTERHSFDGRMVHNHGPFEGTVVYAFIPDQLPEGLTRLQFNMNVEAGTNAAVTVPNVHYNTLCADFRNTTFAQASASAQTYFREHLSVCFNTMVNHNITEEQLGQLIRLHVNLERARNIEVNTGLPPLLSNPEEIQMGRPIGEARNFGVLQCDAFTNSNSRSFITDFAEDIYDNWEGVNQAVCTVTCEEELRVDFDPPASIKAGICMEYEVTVRSRVSCSSRMNIDPPRPRPTCDPIPWCNNLGVIWNNQAGPSEDFDLCIQKYDNGEFTQTGIDFCYNKVYGNSTDIANPMNSIVNNRDVVAEQMSNRCNILNRNGNYGPEQIRNQLLENPGGRFVSGGNTRPTAGSGGRISWQQTSGCRNSFEAYGRWYFATPARAARTVREDLHRGRDHRGLTYVPDREGFKRATICPEHCTWLTGHCANDAFLNPEDAAADYQRRLELYDNLVQRCAGMNVCEENVAKFRWEVDLNTLNNSRTIDFPGPNETDVSTNTPFSPPPSTITPPIVNNNNSRGVISNTSGICYGQPCPEGTAPEDCWHYDTTIRFPGTWMYQKNDAVTWTRPEDDTWWTFHENQFCVPPTARNVNAAWGRWRENPANVNPDGSLRDNVVSPNCRVGAFGNNYADCTPQEKALVSDLIADQLPQINGNRSNGRNTISDRGYNIRGFIEDFGRFSWQGQVHCFYAVDNSNTPPPTNRDSSTSITPPSTPTPPETPVEECVEGVNDPRCTTLSNHEFRIVTPGDLFPGEDRQPGFNWSADAFNPNRPGFEIAPYELRQSIQSIAAAGGTHSREQVDFEVRLTRDIIREIRRGFNVADFESAQIGTGNGNAPFAAFGATFDVFPSSLVRATDQQNIGGAVDSYQSGLLLWLRNQPEANFNNNRGLGCNNSLNRNTCNHIQGAR